jgi:hypothetical protein
VRGVAVIEALCGRGTFNGAAAEVSPFGFAPCVLEKGHRDECDSGPVPQKAA